MQEGLGGIRDVLLDGTQQAYCDIYRQADIPLRQAQSDNIFIGLSPRYVMESVGMALIALLAYVLSLEVGGISTALGAWRASYRCATSVTSFTAGLLLLVNDMLVAKAHSMIS